MGQVPHRNEPKFLETSRRVQPYPLAFIGEPTAAPTSPWLAVGRGRQSEGWWGSSVFSTPIEGQSSATCQR